MRFFIFLAALLCLAVVVRAQPANDNQASATLLTLNSCSGDASETTISATGDIAGSNCLAGTPNYNVWYTFVANATGEVEITIDRGGAKGTLRRAVVTLFDTDGTSELSCNAWVNDGDDVVVSYSGLINTSTYYISVDNHSTAGYQGTFEICLSDQAGYDIVEGAQPLVMDACSADAVYNTQGGTPTGTGSTCLAGTPNYNRWFSFVATATGNVTVTVDRGGSKGTLRRTVVTVFDTDGTTQLACNAWVTDADDVVVSALGLTNGDTYFISVDNHATGGYRGTFTMCLSSALDYDYQTGAESLIMNACSADAAYTTVGATSDLPGSTCYGSSPTYNRWFSFVATATGNVTVTVDRGGVKGTLRRTVVTIFDTDGTTQLACNAWVTDADDVVVSALGLTNGDTYFISVDNHVTGGYRGTFTMCLSDVLDYDYQAGAESLTMNACSADAAYTTVGATSDLPGSTCYGSSPTYNRWFSFVATATGNITVTVDRGGVKGTLRRTVVTIFDTDGTTQLACNAWVTDSDDVVVSALGLTNGDTYFISVDNHVTGGYRGTFTMCLSDVLDYDYQAGAESLTMNACSADAAYTTVGATSDLPGSTCYGSSPTYNRWFSFVATATGNVTVTVDRGGVKGTLRRTVVTIFDTDGTTQLACNAWVTDADDVVVSALGLTNGDTYFISVDNHVTGGYRGTFTMCLSDVLDYDYQAGAESLTMNACSADAAYTTVGATSDLPGSTCYGSSPTYNRWFSFVATATGNITVTVDRGGVKGTLRRTVVTIFDTDGTTQLACNAWVTDADDVVVSALGLTNGDTYFISVDNHVTGGYRGTFTLCLSDALDYDYQGGAFEIADINNWCSSDAQFTTVGATADLPGASCYGSAPQYNRWFTFIATTNFINVTVDRGGSKGTLRRTVLSIWDTDGTTQLACNTWVSDGDDVSMSALTLSPGSRYYISVDNHITGGYRGTFTLCVNDEPDYDFYEGAIELTDLNAWCSADAAYTTIGATSDPSAGSCWVNGPNYNRWFKFTAVNSNVTIQVLRGGAQGTIRRVQMALWESDGTTEVDCNRYVADGDDVTISNATLTPGNDYYISVDNHSTGGYRGSFTLCIDNINQTYYTRQTGVWDDMNNWSTLGYGMGAAPDYPRNGDVANISGYTITVDAASAAAQVNIDASNGVTVLDVDGALLTVNGQLNIQNSGNNNDINMIVQNGGSISILDDLTMTRDGGTNVFDLSVETGSSVLINKDLIFDSNGGSTQNSTMTINGTGVVVVGQDVMLDYSAGNKVLLTLNNSAALTVGRDIEFIATGDNLTEIVGNNTATLNLGRQILRGTPAYGLLTFNNTSTLSFNSGTFLATFPAEAGSGTGDIITLQNVTINNSRITSPQVTMAGVASIPGTLTLTDGILSTTALNLLTLADGATTSGASNNSFVDGPIERIGISPVSFEFPVGDDVYWAPLTVNIVGGDATTSSIAQYFSQTHPDVSTVANPDPEGVINNVSTVEYWDLDITGTFTSADITLHWKDQARSDINDAADLVIAHYISNEWNNIGQSSINYADPGYISVTGISTFSPFTFASTSALVNPLPVELLYFQGNSSESRIDLKWATASEYQNEGFVVEKSLDAYAFDEIGGMDGHGSSSEKVTYQFVDYSPRLGIQYYRLKQIDIDGSFEYSDIISVDYFSEQLLNIFPNPTGDPYFNLNYAGDPKEIFDVYLTDVNGQLIYEIQPSLQEQGSIRVPFDQANGVYILIMKTPRKIYRRKIIKY